MSIIADDIINKVIKIYLISYYTQFTITVSYNLLITVHNIALVTHKKFGFFEISFMATYWEMGSCKDNSF